MWRVLGMYGINSQLLKVVCKVCMKRVRHAPGVCREEGEWFEVGVGMRHGVCDVTLDCLICCMDAAMKEVREKAGDVGVTLRG